MTCATSRTAANIASKAKPLRRRASLRLHAIAVAVATVASLWGAASASALTITEFTDGLTALSQPARIAAGPDGNMWFTASTAGRVGRITPAGVITEWQVDDGGSSPSGITAAGDDLWFVKIKAAQAGIVRITTAGVMQTFSTGGVVPRGWIAVGPNGDLWFTGVFGGNAAIARMSTAGAMVAIYTTGLVGGSLRGITRGPDDKMWFANRNGGIGKITDAGVVTEYGVGTLIATPHEIASADGKLWFTEADGGRIGRITTDGQEIREFDGGLTPSGLPTGIATGPDGNLWIAGRDAHTIARVEPSGAITEYGTSEGLSADSGPMAIAAGPANTLWFADSAKTRIGRVTLYDKPAVSTSAATAIEQTTATLNGSVDAQDAATDAHFEWGTTMLYGTSTTPAPIVGSTPTPITAPLSGLTAGTTYFFKLVATNAHGTSESAGSFTTAAAPPPPPPAVSTSSATAIEQTTATLNGTVDAQDASTSAHFEWGLDTGYGAITSTSTIEGATPMPITASLTGLTAGTTYFFKLVASNAHGTRESAGNFTTAAAPPPLPPAVSTSSATAIAQTTATLNGSVDAQDATTDAHFEWGTTTSYGTSTTPATIVGSTPTPITAPLSGLTAGTTYFFKLVATNAHGTRESAGSFTTAAAPPPAETSPPPAETPPPPAVTPPPPAVTAPPSATPPPPAIAKTTPPPAVPAAVTLDAKRCPLVGRAVIGTDAADARSGGASTDLMFGLAGNDTLRGMAGSDCIFGQIGGDRLLGGAGADTLRGGDGNDDVQGEAGDDTLDGDAGNDKIAGGRGDDSLAGGAGADRLSDASGTDELSGGAGNDRLNARDTSAAGRRASDTVNCGAGSRDVAVVDRRDRVSRTCERVLRR